MIRQRVLYVGIGGTGLDLGIQLHEALQREICGLDGRALTNVGGPFAHLEPDQLPSFIQYLFIDFAQGALTSVVNGLDGSNSTIARGVLPQLNNYPAVAMDLRLRSRESVRSWLPDSTGEPSTAPLSGGAGQFPTVGRASLFSAMLEQGYAITLGNDIQKALTGLGGSLGELNAYTNENASNAVAVYIGFSLSGGTGAGLFLDVLQLVIHEVTAQLGGNQAVIVPIVFLPSTFEGRLAQNKQLRAKLNAGPALIDLAGLIDHRQSPNAAQNPLFAITYPDRTLGTITNAQLGSEAPSVPVISVVSKSPGMKREETERAVAESIVAQLSHDARQPGDNGQTKNQNSFVEDLINDIPDLSKPHRLGMGTHTLMPMIAASLTVPTQKISDVIARSILFRGLEALHSSGRSTFSSSNSSTVEEMLSSLGFAEFVKPETFAEELNIKFSAPQGIKSQKDLDEVLLRMSRQLETNKSSVVDRIKDSVQTKASFSFADGFLSFVRAKPDLSLNEIISIGTAALDRLETTVPKRDQNESEKRRKAKGISLPKRISVNEINAAFRAKENEFKQFAEDAWWEQWSRIKMSWMPSISSGREYLTQIQEHLKKIREECEIQESSVASELTMSKNGVVNFVPTNGQTLDDYLTVLRGRVLDSIRSTLGLQDLDEGVLLHRLVSDSGIDGQNNWRLLADRVKSKANFTQVTDTLMMPVRFAVQNAMDPSGDRPVMPSLQELLRRASDGDTSANSMDLLAELGELVTGQLMPPGSFTKAKVLITYPGEENREVEDFVRRSIALDGRIRNLLTLGTDSSTIIGRTTVKFTASGVGDTLRVNINLIGQGLLDNPEVRDIFQVWANAVVNPSPEKLFWRQRTGFQKIGQIFGPTDRERVVSALIRGLAGGLVEVVDGTLANPTLISIRPDDPTITGALVDTKLEISNISGFSSWPNVIPAFERLVLSVDPSADFRADIIEALLTHVPELLTRGDVAIPQVLYEMENLRSGEIERLRAALQDQSAYGAIAIRSFETALSFWEDTFPRSLHVEIDGGYFRSIHAAMAKNSGVSGV